MKTYQNLWESAKAVLKEKFIALNACIRKGRKRFKSIALNFLFKKLEKEEQITLKLSRRKSKYNSSY